MMVYLLYNLLIITKLNTCMSVTNSTKSFFTAKSYVSDTTDSIGNVSRLIDLNGKLYELKVYHKERNANWKEITDSYLKLAKDIDLQEIMQQIKIPYKKIDIQASIYPNENSICKIQDTDGITRKIARFRLTKSQNVKIFEILKKIAINSSVLSTENLDTLNSSYVAMSLEEIQTERTRNYVEQTAYFNQSVKGLEKPVGFKNKSMNCAFNSCLQMILNEPVLLDIYRTVATYYQTQNTREDKLCGKRMFSVLNAYNQAIKKQESLAKEVSNELRLAMHYLSARKISSDSRIQEDANDILMILFSKYEQILKKEEVIYSLQDYRNALKSRKSLKVPSHLQQILAGKNITQDLLNEIIKERRQTGEANLLNTSLMHYEIEHIVHHEIKGVIKNPVHTDYSILNEDDTFATKHIELDLKIKFDPEQKELTLVNLLQNHFSQGSIEGSEPRIFMKNKHCVKALIVKEELKLSKLPENLLINLERFAPNCANPKKPTKFTNPIEIPEQLDAKLFKEDASDQKYELSSFIVHQGVSVNGGHYIAYRKVDHQWVECNDGCISYPGKEQMLSVAKNSYICFYKLLK